MREKQNSTALMDEMFGLLLAGYAPIEIREKLGIDKNEYMSVCNDSYWHELILGNGRKEKQNRIPECKELEKELFINLGLQKMFEVGTKERAELDHKYMELRDKYAKFNALITI